MPARLGWLAAYAVAMAYLEAAVVVYLRALYYPEGFRFPLVVMPGDMALTEIGREAATLVMILGVAMLAGRHRWERLLFFAFVFGVWDIFYYAWLYVLLGWPPSLATPDILFLIPVPWVSPVLAPILVSVGLVVGSLLILGLGERGAVIGFRPALWGLAIAGGALVLLAFTLDAGTVLAGSDPPPFRWSLFGAGVALGAAALVAGALRLRSMIGTAPRR